MSIQSQLEQAISKSQYQLRINYIANHLDDIRSVLISMIGLNGNDDELSVDLTAFLNVIRSSKFIRNDIGHSCCICGISTYAGWIGHYDNRTELAICYECIMIVIESTQHRYVKDSVYKILLMRELLGNDAVHNIATYALTTCAIDFRVW